MWGLFSLLGAATFLPTDGLEAIAWPIVALCSLYFGVKTYQDVKKDALQKAQIDSEAVCEPELDVCPSCGRPTTPGAF